MDDQIAQFVSITGLDSERAKFFVESAGGDVETALSTFYETEGAQDEDGDDDMDELGEDVAAPAAVPTSSTGARTLSGEPAPDLPADWGKKAAKASSAGKSGGGFSASGGIATLRDVQGDDDEEEDDGDDEDGKKPVNFFTGGERSGLNVQNPDRQRGANAPDIVQSILKKAAEKGKEEAEQGRSSSNRGAAASSVPSFGGQGRTINDEEPPAQTQDSSPATPNDNRRQWPGLTSNALRALRGDAFGEEDRPPLSSADLRALRNMPIGGPEEADIGQDEQETAIRNITFWQDGFTIANGPLCRYDDPQHAETLALINNNRAPLHLLNVRFNQPVELRVERKTNEKYRPPPPEPMKPFGGHGNRLGAPVPSMLGDASSSNIVVASNAAEQPATPATSVPEPSTSFQVDASQPVTQVQIRLGDGQRMIAKFNHSHTVADIRHYINASHPGMTSRSYILQSSFPPKPLTEETQTLEQAGLISAVVIQKWT